MKINTFEKLKEIALQVQPGMRVTDQNGKQREIGEKIFKEAKNKTFAMQRDVVAFCLDGNIYMIPYFGTLSKLLNYAGFRYGSLPMPFSELEYPAEKEAAEKWRRLKQEARTY